MGTLRITLEKTAIQLTPSHETEAKASLCNLTSPISSTASVCCCGTKITGTGKVGEEWALCINPFCTRSYSYVIQVSLDSKEWVTVVDRSNYLCRSWQELFFPKRVIRYVRVIGVHNTMNRSFHLVSLSCFYTRKHFLMGEHNLQSESWFRRVESCYMTSLTPPVLL